MPLLARKKAPQENQVIAVLDIGSASAAAALLELGGEKPVMLAHKRAAMPIDGSRSARVLEARMLAAAREAAQVVRGDPRARAVRDIRIFLPAPWSAVALDRVRFSRAAPFVADEALVRRLLDAHLARDTGAGDTDVFERTLSGVRLNGYAADTLVHDTPVADLELTIASAHAPHSILERLADLAREFFALQPAFHASALALSHALSLIASDEEPYLLCDSEGEVAELVLLRDAIPEAHAAIPMGRAGIVRTLALHGGLGAREIPSALALAGNARSPMANGAGEALESGTRLCAEHLGAGEEMFFAHAPRRAYCVGEQDETRWFRQALQSSERLKAVLPRDFDVRFVGAGDLLPFVGVEARGSDPQLMLEAFFLARNAPYAF